MANLPLQLTFASQPQGHLTTNDLPELLNLLQPVARKCVFIGLQLGISDDTIHNVRPQYPDNQTWLYEILRHRLKQTPPLTWHDVVKALQSNSVQENRIASEIESHYTHQSSLPVSPQVTGTHTFAAPPPLIHHSVPQSALQPNHSPSNIQQHSPLQFAPCMHVYNAVSSHSPQPLLPQPHPPQHPLSTPPPTSTPSQPQVETGQLPSSSQLSSSQLMSVPVTSQAMSGPSPQLSQDLATPHPLQVGEQQALQGQPPLQHNPSHQPQTVAQSHGTGSDSGPPQAKRVHYELSVAQGQGTDSDSDLAWAEIVHSDSPMAQSHGSSSSDVTPQAKGKHKSPVVQSHSIGSFTSPSWVNKSPMTQSHGTGCDKGFPQAKRKHKSPMAQYIEHVKTLYRKREVEKKLSAIKWPPTPSTVYINLVCVDRTTEISKKEADECTRAMVEDGSVDVILKKKIPIDFTDIARSASDSKTLILVEGAPGVGKSTFAWEFCRRWERGEIAQQYQLVLLLRLRDEKIGKAQSLADLICHSSDHIRQAVVQKLEYTQGMGTLIILEGFDELPSTCRTQFSVFMLLIQGELLPNATVLVTSRSWATQVIHRECSDRILQHIEILGFTSDQIEEYVKSVFMGKTGLAEDTARKNIEEVMSYIKTYPQIKACMYIPLNSAIVVSVYQESKSGKCILPRTLTQLYCALTQTLLLRYLHGHPEYGQRSWKIQSLKEDLPQDVYSKLLAISKLAYSGICTDSDGDAQLIFTNLSQDFETLGLMQSVPQLYVTQGEDMSHNFLHLTVQEFLAALHISNMSPEKQLEHFRRQEEEDVLNLLVKYLHSGEEEEGRWRVVLRFLAGITKLANLSPDLLRESLLRNSNEDLTKVVNLSPYPISLSLKKPDADQIIEWYRYKITVDVELCIQHVHWMFEAQRDGIVPLVLQEKTVDFMCYMGLTPLDYYSLGYCIVHSHSHWVLTVEHAIMDPLRNQEVMGGEEVRMLVAGVNTRQDTIAKVIGLRGHDRTARVYMSGSYLPLSISAKALSLLFVELKDMLHLQELHLNLPAECCSIPWPSLSGIRVLHLGIKGGRNWRLDTLLPHLSLESLVIIVSSGEGGLVSNDIASIGELFLFSNCPKHVDITDNRSSITAEVVVGQHVHKTQFDDRTSSVKEKKSVECIRCRLNWYSVGYIIAHSNFQWVLTVEEHKREIIIQEEKKIIGEEEVRKLVAGANTRHDTSAKVVGLRGYNIRRNFYDSSSESVDESDHDSSGYCPLSILAEALNVLFVELNNMLHLQELYFNLPTKCSSIQWPKLSGLRVLHLGMKDKRNWSLDSLLPHLALQELVLVVSSDDGGLEPDDFASIGELFLSSNCPKHVDITDEWSSIAAEVVVGQHVHEKQFDNRTTSVTEKKLVKHIRCRLDWYSVGYVIAHSNFQWMLTVKKDIGEKEVRMLVAGANTKHGTTAKVVGLRGHDMRLSLCKSDYECDHESSLYYPVTVSAEALNLLFVELMNVLYLQELHLNLPIQCSNIQWPNLSGLRVLGIGINGERNWKLDTLLPHLSLELLTIRPTRDGGALVIEDCVAMGALLLSSNCLKYLHLSKKTLLHGMLHLKAEGMEAITKALSENESLPLRYLGVECECTFSDTAAHHLALFITNSTTLHNLSIVGCTFSAHGALELAQTLHHSSNLQKMKLEDLTCTVDGDDEVTDYAQLSIDYSQLMSSLTKLTASHICGRGVQVIATALHHNSTLIILDLSNNHISDTGSAVLAQALLYNSTLRKLNLSNNNISDTAALAEALHLNSTLQGLDLSGNNDITAEGTHHLVQALTVNRSILNVCQMFSRHDNSAMSHVHVRNGLVLPRRCWEYATQCPQYSKVQYKIKFE